MARSLSPTGGILYTTTWGQSSESEELVYDNLTVDRSFGGIVRVRSSVPLANILKTFRIVHSVLTLAEKEALHTFYTTYRDSTLDFKWKADSYYYPTRFIEPPKYTMLGGTYWKAEVSLAEI